MSRPSAFLILASFLAGANALLATPRLPHTAPLARAAAVRCQEADEPAAPTLSSEVDQTKVDLVDRASDPFRAVRVVLYATFGVAGLAGVVTSLIQMGDNTADAMGNLAVNSGVLIAGVAIFFVDQIR